ncbi:MAG: hypothetical protein Q3X91_09930, partial [Bilophila sp.]|nr:hypothetical protein [Bilophila sp.]
KMPLLKSIVNISEKIFQLQHLYSPIAYDFRVLETDEMLLSQPEQHGVSRSGKKSSKIDSSNFI